MGIWKGCLQLAIVFLGVQFGHSLRFYLPANGKRCLKEEIHKHALVKGKYELSDTHGHHTTIKVRAKLCVSSGL